VRRVIRNTIILAAATAFCLVSAAGCRSPGSATSTPDGRKTLAVSIVPQKSLLEAISGGRFHILTAIRPGFSPENYEPTPQEAQALEQADLYFSIGVPAEQAAILPQISHARIVDLAAEIDAAYPDLMIEPGERDPHVWLSPKRAKVMAAAMARELISLDPAGAAEYMANRDVLLGELDRLDQEIRALFSVSKRRVFFVFHPSLGYFADDYGLVMHALEEHGKEATPKHLQALIDLAAAEQVQTVFAQAEIDSRQLDAFATETGSTVKVLDPLPADYLDGMRAMARAIAEALPDA
jgi:zinc transport system substrate-binding protein